MKDPTDKVEIVEPPIGELTKKNGGLKRTCITGCGCIVLFIIGSIIAIRIALGPGPKEIKTLPPNFPSDIPIYDRDNIEKITFISGKYKNRGMEIAAFFPKVILSPLLLNNNQNSQKTADQTQPIKKFWDILTTPVGDKRNTVQIEWKNIDAEPNFVISFYRNELRKKGYLTDEENPNVRRMTFSNAANVSGELFIETNDEDHPGTDYAMLTVNFSE